MPVQLIYLLMVLTSLSLMSRSAALIARLPNRVPMTATRSTFQLNAVRRRTTRLDKWELAKAGVGGKGGGTSASGKTGKGGKRADKRQRGGMDIDAQQQQQRLHQQMADEGQEIRSGLVIERLGDRLLIEPDDDNDSSSSSSSSSKLKLICSQRSRLCNNLIVVGDKVDFFAFAADTEKQDKSESDSDSDSDAEEREAASGFGTIQGVVVGHQERRNLLQRPAGGGNVRVMKSIAANIDQVMLVVAGSPQVPLPTIDRVLVTAHKYDMKCVIVLNKVDEEESTAPFRKALRPYSDLGYQVVEVSAKATSSSGGSGSGSGSGGGSGSNSDSSNGNNGGDSGIAGGMEALRNALKGRSSVFVGQSGVGKSSLVNALLPLANARVGDLVRSANQIGAHTTSSSRLFHLADMATGAVGRQAGAIIDSPGIREIGLWHLPVEDIREGFVEVNEASKQCKYRNCTHTFNQEGCGVIAALEAGTISTARYDSYMDLVNL